MGQPDGFAFEQRKSGEVVIRHHGRVAATLRGARAVAFLEDASTGDDQALMARATGNYKRGNERAASQHPRNER
ncbi:MAG: hypothetical protein ABIW84_06205 [Ilumatobacteraceae bacterium]